MTILPFDDRDGKIWYNGQLVDWRDAKTHVLNHGLHYASCVFEGVRVYNSKIFKLTEHTERLFYSAEQLGFKIPYTVEEINNATKQAVEVQNVVNGYVRPVAWRGSEMMAISSQHAKIHVAIAAWAWPAYFSEEARSKGLRLTFGKWRRPLPETAPVHAKAAGLYMISTLNKHAAEAAGFDDAMYLDAHGNVAEATGANFFMVINGELHTPTPDCFLDGITRRTVIDLAKAKGLKVIERTITPAELANADEAFLTGTAAEVTPIASIDDYKFTVGEVTRGLMAAYADEVKG